MEHSTPKKTYEIVVGLDFSDLSRRALEEAIDLATRHAPAALHVIVVGEQQGTLVRLPGDAELLAEDMAGEKARQRVADVLDAYRSRNEAVELEKVAVYVVAGDPAELLTELARAVDASLIVVGTHGRRGLDRVLLGSVAASVVRQAGCGVYVVRPPDFVYGHQVPEIQPPLAPGEPHLKQFEHRHTIHYVDKVAPWTSRTMPVS